MSKSGSLRHSVATMSTGVFARVTAVGLMSCVALVSAPPASSAADAVATAPDSAAAGSGGFDVFGMPMATTVWLLAGVLAVLVGLVGASRRARAAGLGAPTRLVTAGVDDAPFAGATARRATTDAEGDRS